MVRHYCSINASFPGLCSVPELSLCRVAALISLPVHRYRLLVFHFLVLWDCWVQLMIHWWVRKSSRGPNKLLYVLSHNKLRARLGNRFKPPSILMLTVPRRYFSCGSLLLLVLAVSIYTLVHLLCEWHILSLDSWMTTCLGRSCSFGLPRVPFVNCCQFMYLFISLFGFEGRIWDLIVSVPDHCFLIFNTNLRAA